MRRITSRQNATVAEYRAAARGDATSPLLLDGEHLIRDALAAGIVLHHAMVAADTLTSDEFEPLLAQLSARHVDVAVGSSSVMDAVSPVRSASPIVALAARPVGGSVFASTPPLVIVACDVQDPGNLGAMVRAAEASAASGLIAAGASADPFGWKALRGSMGSALRLPIDVVASIEDALVELRRQSCRTIATVPSGGRSLFDIDLTGPVAVLIGSEGHGLPSTVIATADGRLTIPMQPPVESLNAAVTAALIVYEARRQRS